MKYLKISGWDIWQTFRKDRGAPPWIKLHRNLLTNPEWLQLSDQEKGQLVSIWMAAADKNGKIPNNPQFIKKMCLLDQAPNLKRFKELGFIDGNVTTKSDNQLVDTVTPNGCQDDAPEESRVEERRVKPLRSAKDADPGRDEFENLWNQYPEKKGKHEAWLKFKSQVKSPQDLINIINALRNYKKDMDHVRRDHPDRAWLHGSTWFNKRWEDFIDYKPPPNGKPTPPKPIKVETPKPEDHVPPGELKKMVQNFTKKLKGVDE